MKAEMKVTATVTLEMTEEEYIWLAQLAGQVAGDGRRARFYRDFNATAFEILRKRREAFGPDFMPAGRPYFDLVKGGIQAYDLPANERAHQTIEKKPEPDLPMPEPMPAQEEEPLAGGFRG